MTGIEYPNEVDMSLDFKDLITRLLNPSPESRLKAHGVKDHVLFSNLDWHTIRQKPAPFLPKPQDLTDTTYFDGMYASLSNRYWRESFIIFKKS